MEDSWWLGYTFTLCLQGYSLFTLFQVTADDADAANPVTALVSLVSPASDASDGRSPRFLGVPNVFGTTTLSITASMVMVQAATQTLDFTQPGCFPSALMSSLSIQPC